MPLLNKKPFVPKLPPQHLQPTNKVFYCDITREVFISYEEYWERLVLCNAMVWTCELTGRPNLTYTEALESENKARKCLANIPQMLRKPMLYIATLTRRGRFADMSEDVFNFIRDRYFVGEAVEAIVKKHWYDCKVTKIIYPTPGEIARYEEEMAETDEEEEVSIIEEVEKEKHNGEVDKTSGDKGEAEKMQDGDDDIQIIKVVKSPAKTPPKKVEEKKEDKKADEDENYPPFATFKYEVEEIEPWDYEESQRHTVTWEQIRRNKGVVTREKCKLYLKQCVQLSPAGFWTIKEGIFKKYGLGDISYSDVFVGKPPKFQETRAKKIPASGGNKAEKKLAAETKKREKKEAREKNNDAEAKKKGRPVMTEQDKEARKKLMEEEKEARKKMLKEVKEGLKAEKKEELKQKLEREKEERKREREIKKEEKRLQDEYLKEWRRPRDDLDCDDHKDLPKPTPVQCRIPDNMFSDFVTVLEFVNVFSELLELKDVYPQGITFDMLEHALVEKEIAGVLNDIFQLLLQAIFTLQEEEDDEVEADTAAEEVMEADTSDISIQEAVMMANRAAMWSQQYHGLPLQKVPLDALTLTEVLRLHLLASGATNVANGRWRHLNRGGFKHLDDPGLQFKLEEPALIKSLASSTAFDLSLEHKLKILCVLIGQILTYASVRDIIDENIEKLREMKNKLRLHQVTQIRKEKEYNAAKLAEKRERKQKELERRLKEAEKKAALAAMTGEPDKPIELEDDDEEEEEEEEEEEDESEKAARAEKEERNKEARRQDFLKRERELMQQVLNMAKGVNNPSLGQDRAYRRYWIFSYLPGLFVEDNEENAGLCRLTPTPYDPNSNPDLTQEIQDMIRQQAVENISKILDKEEKSNSDKENDGSDCPKQAVVPVKNLLQMPNHIQPPSDVKVPEKLGGLLNPPASGAESELKMCSPKMNGEVIMEPCDMLVDSDKTKTDIVSGSHEPPPDIYGLCTANMKNCPVHCERSNRHKWWFFYNPEDLNSLISCLNIRGYREKELKNALDCYKTIIETSMKACPVYKLDPAQEPELDSATRKSQRNLTTKKTADANLNFPPGTPIEDILQMTLRDMILETEEKIHMGMLGSLRLDDREAWRNAIEEGGYIRGTPLDYGGRKRITQFKMELGLEVSDEQDGEDMLEEVTETGIVKDMAQAILQLGQSIDAKYLQPPLGETDKSRKKRERIEEKLRRRSKKKEESSGESSGEESDSDQEEKKAFNQVNHNALRTPIERWEVSLMASTSLSQLCLHYATLDNSITWSRSALNARCRICRRRTDAEKMLLCDGCDKGHHMFCLKPKLKEIPSGDWYCDRCKPKEKPKSPRKNRQIYKDVSEDEMEEEDDEEEGGSEEDTANNNCFVCGNPGTLICCDTCPLAYHQECAELRKIPRGTWSCRQCQSNAQAKSKDSPPGKKKNSKENSKSSKDSNKENKSKKETKINKEAKNNKKTPKNAEKLAKSKKNSPLSDKKRRKNEPPEKRRRSDGDATRPSKRLKLDEYETGWTPPKRTTGRRSLVDEDSPLNSPALETILDELQRHPSSWPFMKPVSKKMAPDYYEIVKKPMDFRTIREKLNSMKYLTDGEFISDVMLVFQNCQQYNMEDTEEYDAGTLLTTLFVKRLQELGLSAPPENKKYRC